MKLELARLFQILHRFDKSAQRLNSIRDGDRLPAKLRRIFIDLSIQNNRRKAEYLVGNGDFEDALKCLQDAREVYETSSQTLIDWRTLHNLKRAWKTVPVLKRAFLGLPQQKLVDDFSVWLSQVGSDAGAARRRPTLLAQNRVNLKKSRGATPVPEDGPPNRGRLPDLRASFGFIEFGGRKLFFHKANWIIPIDFRLLGEGTVVQFDVDGDNAVNVRPVAQTPHDAVMSRRFLGTVHKVHSVRPWIYKVGYRGEIFFGKDSCAETTQFSRLILGDRVQFNVAIDQRGGLHATKVELYSGTAV